MTSSPSTLPMQLRDCLPRHQGRRAIAVLCDNSPDLDRVPSDLSDFCLTGDCTVMSILSTFGVALDAVHILPVVAADGSAQVSVKRGSQSYKQFTERRQLPVRSPSNISIRVGNSHSSVDTHSSRVEQSDGAYPSRG